MTDKPKAKLIRVEPHKTWYLTNYYFECVDCGSEYHRHRNDNRISPYCGMCQRKHDTERARERIKERERMTDTELLNELEKRAEAYHDKVKKDFAIEELEKIKAEIEEMKGNELPYNASDYLYGRYQAFDIVVDILQDRIAELKGEQ